MSRPSWVLMPSNGTRYYYPFGIWLVAFDTFISRLGSPAGWGARRAHGKTWKIAETWCPLRTKVAALMNEEYWLPPRQRKKGGIVLVWNFVTSPLYVIIGKICHAYDTQVWLWKLTYRHIQYFCYLGQIWSTNDREVLIWNDVSRHLLSVL